MLKELIILVYVSKGIELEINFWMFEVIEDEIDVFKCKVFVVFFGLSYVEEVVFCYLIIFCVSCKDLLVVEIV